MAAHEPDPLDSVAGVDARPPSVPQEREPDEAEKIIRAASPWRLIAKVAAVGAVAGVILGGMYLYRSLRRSRLAASPPMVSVPAGTYRMGVDQGARDERPAHEVTVAAFQVDLTEVTVSAYALCVKATKCSPPAKHENCTWGRADREDHPINCVDWHQATAYCAWAGKRLPTEEEWEYAARGADERRYPWGNDLPTARLLNVCDGDCRRLATKAHGQDPHVMHEESDGWGATAPVGSYPAGKSPFGVLDLAGNVWEWTASAYCPYATPGCASTRRVSRGGGWTNAYRANVESTSRSPDEPTSWSEGLGFRCAR